ncbi:MAG TPA: carbohydrate-binding family V/XII, partial [Thermoanaerobaculia bacterium]|nr:carbohydrate-binding family V/XII [Thermoanaerobaculia bacterium]
MIASRFVRLFALAAAAALLLPLRPAAAVSPADGWPRQFTTEKGNSVVVYQPQLESFSGDAVTGRAAVSFTPAKGGSARYGVVFFTAEVSVDRDARTV